MRRSGGEEKFARVIQDIDDNGEVCCRCDREVQGGGGTASRISSEPLLVAMVMDRLTDEVRQEPPWTMMSGDDFMMILF